MVFEVPKSKASIKQNRFEFKLPGGAKVYSLPLAKYLKPALAMRMDKDQTEAMFLLFESYYPGEQIFDKFEDGEQFEAFINAWNEASGIDMGESSASSDS